MRPRTQKQPQVKKELCRALDDVDVDTVLRSEVSSLCFADKGQFDDKGTGDTYR